MTSLSVLDQSPIRRGGTPAQAIAESVELARVADRLGYRRYWLAEHHNSAGLACASPEVLIPQVAAATERIRVGSGGVMLSHYSPLKVAESFMMLEALYPGRIDLGIGRAPGSDGRTARALAPDGALPDVERFPAQLAELDSFLGGGFPLGHPNHGIRAMPAGEATPEIWLLGSTGVSAGLAARFGWAFSFAQFISPEGGEDVVRAYRQQFRPSSRLARSAASIGVAVTCAATEAEAERLCWSRWAWRVMANQPGRSGIPSVEEAQAYPYSAQERAYLEYMRERSIYGDPEQVRAKLLALGDRYDVDEFVVVTITYDFAARVRSYELLAEAFGLDGASTTPGAPG